MFSLRQAFPLLYSIFLTFLLSIPPCTILLLLLLLLLFLSMHILPSSISVIQFILPSPSPYLFSLYLRPPPLPPPSPFLYPSIFSLHIVMTQFFLPSPSSYSPCTLVFLLLCPPPPLFLIPLHIVTQFFLPSPSSYSPCTLFLLLPCPTSPAPPRRIVISGGCTWFRYLWWKRCVL